MLSWDELYPEPYLSLFTMKKQVSAIGCVLRKVSSQASPVFVLQFAFSIIHRSGRVVFFTNQLGTKNEARYMLSKVQWGIKPGYWVVMRATIFCTYWIVYICSQRAERCPVSSVLSWLVQWHSPTLHIHVSQYAKCGQEATLWCFTYFSAGTGFFWL